MARSRKKASSRGSRSTKATSRKSSRKAAPAAEVEVVEESKGLGIDDGIAIITGILVLAAFLVTDHYRGSRYGEGMLFKNSYEVPAQPTAPSE